MLTYQVKIKIDASVESEWLAWMKIKHVPDVIATGLIKSFQILKPESKEQLYLFHYHFESRKDYERYQKEFASELKTHPTEKFPNRFTAERELLEWI